MMGRGGGRGKLTIYRPKDMACGQFFTPLIFSAKKIHRKNA